MSSRKFGVFFFNWRLLFTQVLISVLSTYILRTKTLCLLFMLLEHPYKEFRYIMYLETGDIHLLLPQNTRDGQFQMKR